LEDGTSRNEASSLADCFWEIRKELVTGKGELHYRLAKIVLRILAVVHLKEGGRRGRRIRRAAVSCGCGGNGKAEDSTHWLRGWWDGRRC